MYTTMAEVSYMNTNLGNIKFVQKSGLKIIYIL